MATSYTLKVSGATRDFAIDRLRMLDLTVSYDGPRVFNFYQTNLAHFHGAFDPFEDVELIADGATIFIGKIITREAVGDPGREKVVYNCFGPRMLAEEVILQDATTGVENVSFNMRRTDPDWEQGREFMTCGQILKEMFDDNATTLRDADAAPASGDPYIQGELDAMSVVPSETLTYTNTGFTSAIDEVLEWQPRFVFRIDPETLIWHFDNRDDLTPRTITFVDVDDRVIRDVIQEDVEDAYTALLIRGRPTQTNKVLKLSTGDLEKRWDTALDATWTIQKAMAPVVGDEESGTPTSITTTVLTDTSASWSANQWDDGWVELKTTSGKREHRPITSHTATTIIWGTVLLIPVAEITSYRVWQPHPPEWYVWRRFRPTAAADQKIAKIADPWLTIHEGYFGSAVTPTLQAVHDFGTGSMTFNAPALVTEDGTEVIANMPLAAYVTLPADLHSAGSLVAPDDVILHAPIFGSPLSARYPLVGFEGTAFDRFNIERVKIEHVDRWVNPDQQGLFEGLAEELLHAHKEVSYSGEINLSGFFGEFSDLGHTINIAAFTTFEGASTTGWEDAKILLKEVRYEWSDREAHTEKTTLALDNDRRTGRARDRVFSAVENALTFIEFAIDTRTQVASVTVTQVGNTPRTDPFGAPIPGL